MGAPTTSDLRALVLNTGFKMSDNKTRVTRFIYQTLIDNGYSDKDVNFETIISVIEELVVYYSDFDSSRRIPSIYRCLFESKFNDEILNFSIEGGKPVAAISPVKSVPMIDARGLNNPVKSLIKNGLPESTWQSDCSLLWHELLSALHRLLELVCQVLLS